MCDQAVFDLMLSQFPFMFQSDIVGAARGLALAGRVLPPTPWRTALAELPRRQWGYIVVPNTTYRFLLATVDGSIDKTLGTTASLFVNVHLLGAFLDLGQKRLWGYRVVPIATYPVPMAIYPTLRATSAGIVD